MYVEKIHAREVKVYTISAGCPNDHQEFLCKTMPLTPISERFAKELTSLTICQKEHPLIKSLFEATSFALVLKEFTAFRNDHVVEIQKDGTCRLWQREENDFDEVPFDEVLNFGTAKTPAFLYKGGFFVLCGQCQEMVHTTPKVLAFSDDRALLILGDDLLLKFDLEKGFETLGDFVAFYQTKKSVLLEVRRRDGLFALYHIGNKSIEKLFDVNKNKGDWFTVETESGDVAFRDPHEACGMTGISNLFKIGEDGVYVALF
ncbi:MAG: hypothetical protein IJS26_04180 [Alphaproteobacteria bacterium]|nr:hypothetical protein [Alphaproteobacteria bacterium]